MKYISHLSIFESEDSSLPKPITIKKFIEELSGSSIYNAEGIKNKEEIISWWNQNRKGFKIYYFDFKSNEPIAGCFLDKKSIAINKKLRMPPMIRFFIALHESGHCNQYAEGNFESKYFDPVVNEDREKFLEGYKELEKDANDYAENALKEMGFQDFLNRQISRLRHNEYAGHEVYGMMRRDIKKYNPKNFIDLLKGQII